MIVQSTRCLFIVVLVSIAVACGRSSGSETKEAWDMRNNPINLTTNLEPHLARLPIEGRVSNQPWSDIYWPSMNGGLANRWRVSQDNFSYQPPNREEFRAMTLAQRSALSPAEKYDLFMGRYDFPLLRSERSRTSPTRPGWEGLCHGWAVAAMNFKEPQPVLVRSLDGIEIPFGSSDIKGLLSLVQGNYNRAQSRVVGARCNISLNDFPQAENRSECRDLNAGAFHVLLANFIGIHRKGFVLDVTRDLQVWNQPVTSFESKVLGEVPLVPTAARSAVRSIRIETSMGYQGESFLANWEAIDGTPQSVNITKIYQYDLELDSQGRIVGGEWIGADRPDFLWVQGMPAFTDYFAGLGGIYRDSVDGGEPLPDPAASQAAF